MGEPRCGVDIVVSERMGAWMRLGFAGESIQRLSSPPIL